MFFFLLQKALFVYNNKFNVFSQCPLFKNYHVPVCLMSPIIFDFWLKHFTMKGITDSLPLHRWTDNCSIWPSWGYLIMSFDQGQKVRSKARYSSVQFFLLLLWFGFDLDQKACVQILLKIPALFYRNNARSDSCINNFN